jgi:hypothetical protein
MKSPFPGMDPYLERHWEDVHTRLIGYVADALQPQLSEDLIARMEEKVYVEDEGETRLRKPDVRVVESLKPWEPDSGAIATAVLDEPMLLEPLGDPIRQRSVLIYDSIGNRIITAIEILGPWNKSPRTGVARYLLRRTKHINDGLNLVEIDLVRAGDWAEMIGPHIVPRKMRTPYRVTLHQPELSGPLIYPISIRMKLPTIKVPLRPHDVPAKLNLQELIEKAYVMGRYDRIDYTKPCKPEMVGAEKDWADEILVNRAKQV